VILENKLPQVAGAPLVFGAPVGSSAHHWFVHEWSAEIVGARVVVGASARVVVGAEVATSGAPVVYSKHVGDLLRRVDSQLGPAARAFAGIFGRFRWYAAQNFGDLDPFRLWRT
jgi:poly-gamma-glutamate capsule biosynthesis protein CapA/YwtB (metallophosphatase superfamily)